MTSKNNTSLPLIVRLRQHEKGARQQCQCRSNQSNCIACDCGAAADEISRLCEILVIATRALDRIAFGDIQTALERIQEMNAK